MILVQDGNEVFFRIKRSTQLKKLMNAYCDRQSVDINSIAFLFDGRRLRGEQSPDEVALGSLTRLHSLRLNFFVDTANFLLLMYMHFRNFLFVVLSQLEMEDGDEIDAMLHQTGGTAV